MARIKHVVTNPYHLWAHQVQDWAKNGSGNQSFRDTRAYSYAATIGVILTDKKGNRAYMVTPRTWSSTTNGHQSSLRRSIPDGSTVFHVYNMDPYGTKDHLSNVKDYWAKIDEHNGKAKRARAEWSIASNASTALRTMQELRAYVKFFKLKGKAFAVPSTDDVEAATAVLAVYKEAEAVALKAEAKRQEAADRQRRIDAQETIDKWIAGEPVRVPYLTGEAFLRVKEDVVQTSQGAEVPADHVRKIMPLVLKIVNAGREFKAPPEAPIRLGHYSLNLITKEGTVHVGCHKFSKSEVLRFAESLTA